jgi:hypothetical protein
MEITAGKRVLELKMKGQGHFGQVTNVSRAECKARNEVKAGRVLLSGGLIVIRPLFLLFQLLGELRH